MKQQQFEQLHSEQWALLAHDLEKLENYKTKLDAHAVVNFPQLYRQVCQHLAIARDRHYTPALIERLNRLVLDGHQYLYVTRSPLLTRIIEFIAYGFPRAVRANKGVVFASALCFFGSLLGMTFLVYLYDDHALYLLSPGQLRQVEAMYNPSAQHWGQPREADSDLYMFGFYIRHNISIGFQTFASGLLFAVGSVFYLLFNGLYIGCIAGHLINKGYNEPFFSFVAGHSAFELTAIMLAGAAGLKLGLALLAPQRNPRLQALQQAALSIVPLIYGFFTFFLFAAFIEAYWSSKALLNPELKYSVGIGLWVIILLYFSFAGRSHAD
jgi:uncharacterized membrane protein SpoIIM required for sporulation